MSTSAPDSAPGKTTEGRLWAWLKRGWAWLSDHFFPFSAGLITLFSLVLLFFWVLVNLFWPAKHSLLKREVFGTEPGPTLEVRYPAVVLADTTPAKFTFVLHARSPLTVAQSITTTLPLGLLPAGLPPQSEVLVRFSGPYTPTTTYTTTLSVHNARTLLGSSEQQLAFRLSPALSTMPPPGSVSFRVEGVWRWAVRVFVNSTVNERSPLIILVAGSISAVGFLYREHQKTVRERAEREEKQKQMSITKQRRKELEVQIDRWVDIFRKQWIAGDRERVREIPRRLDEAYSGLVAGDLEGASRVLERLDTSEATSTGQVSQE